MGSFTGDPEGYVQEGSGNGHLSIGAPLGNLERGSFTRDFERWMRWGPIAGTGEWGSIDWELWEFVEGGLWIWSISLYGSSVRGTWRGGSFVGGPKGYEGKALGTGISLYGNLAKLEWANLPGNLRYG